MYRKPGPPGEYYGYIDIGGVSYKFSARSLPDTRPNAPKRSKYFTGSVQRNLKADQQSLPLTNEQTSRIADKLAQAPAAPFLYFNDELPEKL
jgi:hypothetical protein